MDVRTLLNRIASPNIDLSHNRLNKALSALKLSPPRAKIITVGGTNGKGSCVYLLESILLEAGYSVGLYTSPHLSTYTERFRINGQSVTESKLYKTLITLKSFALTHFECLTLAMWRLFEESNLDVWILEVGLGGRWDAVNVIDPDLSIIVSIDLDHTDRLGDTREAIGFEKAGIMRASRPTVCGDINPPQSLIHHAEHLGSPFFVQGRAFGFKEAGTTWDFWSEQGDIKFLPKPRVLLENAASVLKTLECLRDTLAVSLDHIHQGLQRCFIPGRFQTIAWAPQVILDVAHNPAAGRMLARQLNAHPSSGRTLGVVGMLDDKDIKNTLRPMLPCVDEWVAVSVSNGHDRGGLAEKVAQYLPKALCFDSVKAGIDHARLHAKDNDRIIVFGSFYTVGAALHYFMQQVST